MQRSNEGCRLSRRVRRVLAGLLAVSAVCVQSTPAAAQWAVACVNCATMWTQTLQYAKEAESVLTQLQQYQTQLQQYANMVTNTVALPQEAWSTVQSDIMRVQALSNAASLLSGNSGSLISRLQGASSYANQIGSLSSIGDQFTTYQQAIGNNLSTMGRQLGLQQGMESNNATLLTSLQQHSQSAQGQMQAIQAGNELAHAQATQLMQIQATLSTTAQMQATQMAVSADRQGLNDAAITHFNSPSPVPTTGYQSW
ncbi:MAG TPA: P-type conjugative transfer protein TrbJ [Candidatus Saccharimonadales bacterium]|nr:P-type conjugative transfer protein TrbJ [Candidatus Saccharimonadales bacterium]